MKRSRLGQNFLFDRSIAERIVDSAGVGPDGTVVEIGPGYGTMTEIIAQRVNHLIAIELDTKIYDRLLRDLSPFTNIELINMDVMGYDFSRLEPFRVIANIPYYITTPILFKLIEQANNLVSMTLTMQKEVAERIVASPNSKSYGVLSLMVQYYGKPQILFTIPAGAFTPRPKVDSAVIRIDRYAKPPVDISNHEVFVRIIKTSFGSRRKMIANTLKKLYPDIRHILNEADIDPKRRPETLTLQDFALLSNKIVALQSHAC